MFFKLFKKIKINAHFTFEAGDYCFGFERIVSEDFKNYLSSNIKHWMGDEPACAIRWPECFDEHITLAMWDDKYLPRGIVVRKDYIRESRKVISLENSFNTLPKLSIPLRDFEHIFYKFSKEFNYASIFLNETCNIKCSMCFFHGDKFSKNRKKTRVALDEKNLTLFLDQLANKTPLLISASGEILLHPQLVEMLTIATQKNDHIVIGTNGLLFTNEIASKVLELGIDEVNFSVDGIDPEFYESVRIGSNFSKVVNNIISFRKLRDEGNFKTQISINCVLFDEIIPNQDRIIDFWKGKADKVSFLSERKDYLADNNELHRFSEIKEFACFEPFFEGPVLSPDGSLFPCCPLALVEWFETLPWIHNINNISIENAMKNYRQMMLQENSPLRLRCQACKFWVQSFKDSQAGMHHGVALD